MPGYLSHLAARAFGAKPAIRPRLPSLFESAPGMPATAQLESSTLAAVEQERLASQPPSAGAVAPPLPGLQPAVQAAPVPATEQMAVPERPRRPARQAVEAERQPAPTPAARSQPLEVTLAAQAPPQPLQVVVRPEVRAVEAPETAPPTRPSSPQPAPRSDVETQRPWRSEPPRQPMLRQPPDESRSERIRAVSERAPAAPPPARSLALLIAPQPEIRPAQRTPAFVDSVAQQYPSVQVTIGRLVVEAQLPAPTPLPLRAPRALAPRLSLDDYLRQRRSQA